MSSYSTRHNQTALSSTHHYFTFLDVNQSCAVIKICLSGEAGAIPRREKTTTLHMAHWCPHRWTCAGSLVLSWGGIGEVPPRPSGLSAVPLGSPALTITWQPLPCWLKINYAVYDKMEMKAMTTGYLCWHRTTQQVS